MTIKHLLTITLLLWAATAQAQWDVVVPLSHDGHQYLFPKVVVDDDWRLHFFYIRSLYPNQPYQPEALFYQQFDNWGNALTQPLDVAPGANDLDFSPGVLRDRDGYIHVAWGRNYYPPFDACMMYARFNPQGQIVTGPLRVPSEDSLYYALSGVNLVQRANGDIWIACDEDYFVVSATGEIVSPLRKVVNESVSVSGMTVGVTSGDLVWGCVRFVGNGEQSISILRLDTSGLAREVVATGWPDWIQMTPDAFAIDTADAFHYIIAREDAGITYQRDARDGSSPDTLIIDRSFYGGVSSFFVRVGTDTLEYLWDHGLPPAGYRRIGFRFDGNVAFGPWTLAYNDFVLEFAPRYIWKAGSYWLPGKIHERPGAPWQLAMIHVPGPHEPPPNAVRDRESRNPSSTSRLTIHPQPVQSDLHFELSQAVNGVVTAAVYNLIGQRLYENQQEGGGLSAFHWNLPALSAGPYFLVVKTTSDSWSTRFVHIK